MTLLALVQLDHLLRVDRQARVWVHNDAEEPRVGLQAIISCLFSQKKLTVLQIFWKFNITTKFH